MKQFAREIVDRSTTLRQFVLNPRTRCLHEEHKSVVNVSRKMLDIFEMIRAIKI